MKVKLLVIVTLQVMVSPPTEPVLLHWSTVLVAAAVTTRVAVLVRTVRSRVTTGAGERMGRTAGWDAGAVDDVGADPPAGAGTGTGSSRGTAAGTGAGPLGKAGAGAAVDPVLAGPPSGVGAGDGADWLPAGAGSEVDGGLWVGEGAAGSGAGVVSVLPADCCARATEGCEARAPSQSTSSPRTTAT